MRKSPRLLLPLAALGALLTAASCANPRAEANMAQSLNDAANEISGLKNDLANLQAQIDSLQATSARQDSLINRIMTVANIPR